MTSDLYGNSVTCDDPTLLTGINDFIHGFLAYEPKATNIMPLADVAPNNCIANAYTAWLWMFLEAPIAASKAKPFADRAVKAAASATPREAMLAHLAQLWVANDIDTLLAKGEALLTQHPRDLATLKLLQYHLFNRGDAAGMLRVGLICEQAAGDVSYTHGMIAFGYEQCHLLDQAELAARKAMAIKHAEPWAHHALAHVMLTQGRVDEGIAFLESVADTWTGMNSFMRSHNWWHLALFYLSRARHDDLLRAYDTHIWGLAKTYSQDQVGAVSLLVRMELAGVDVGDRWEDVAKHIEERGVDTVQPFLTLQYIYALGRTGRDTDPMLQAIEIAAEHDPVWRDVALPAAIGLIAHTAQDWGTTITRLGLALPRMAETGGSHAQRDLFEQIHLDALMKSGRMTAAQQVLEMRRSYDPDGVPVNRQLAEVYKAVGLAPLAEIASARANATAGQSS